jgi:1-acyl-sn-glycerol-3-phosphate acyltransferase
MKRETLRNILCWLMDHITKSTYYGLENIPASGPVIIATNHLSRLDIPLIFCNPRRDDLTALVTTKYLKYPGLSWILRTEKVVWIDRDIADFGAIRVASEALKKGVSLGISPEGTRSKNHGLAAAKSGVVLLAMKSGAPIVPVGVWGTETGMKRLLTFRKPIMFARFGQAFQIPPVDRENRTEDLKRWTDEVMCRIAVLIPEAYRGIYKDHPITKSLLASMK